MAERRKVAVYFASGIVKDSTRSAAPRCVVTGPRDLLGYVEDRSSHFRTGHWAVACDHGCFHGGGTVHGVGGRPDTGCEPGSSFSTKVIYRLAMEGIKRADVVYALINKVDAYGTLTELLHACAIGKPVVLEFHAGVDPCEFWFLVHHVQSCAAPPHPSFWSSGVTSFTSHDDYLAYLRGLPLKYAGERVEYNIDDLAKAVLSTKVTKASAEAFADDAVAVLTFENPVASTFSHTHHYARVSCNTVQGAFAFGQLVGHPLGNGEPLPCSSSILSEAFWTRAEGGRKYVWQQDYQGGVVSLTKLLHITSFEGENGILANGWCIDSKVVGNKWKPKDLGRTRKGARIIGRFIWFFAACDNEMVTTNQGKSFLTAGNNIIKERTCSVSFADILRSYQEARRVKLADVRIVVIGTIFHKAEIQYILCVCCIEDNSSFPHLAEGDAVVESFDLRNGTLRWRVWSSTSFHACAGPGEYYSMWENLCITFFAPNDAFRLKVPREATWTDVVAPAQDDAPSPARPPRGTTGPAEAGPSAAARRQNRK